MDMTLPIKNSVKVLLLNEENELLLMSADDPLTTSIDGKSHGVFWFPIGGTIEKGETIKEAAIREVYPLRRKTHSFRSGM
jgi:8-oxo-dGTP pyrophosphatase MutT (NUDIX family)